MKTEFLNIYWNKRTLNYIEKKNRLRKEFKIRDENICNKYRKCLINIKNLRNGKRNVKKKTSTN